MHPQGKYNALLPPLSLFLPFSLFLCSRHFRARQREDLSRGEARQNLTPSPLPSSSPSLPPPPPSPSTPRRAFRICYKRVRERAIRQRCNTVLRTQLSQRISYFVDFVSSIRSKRKFKGNLSINTFTRNLPSYKDTTFLFLFPYIIFRRISFNLLT